MDSLKKSFIFLHLAVFLFGFTGILGKLIILPALVLVWWRALLSWIIMLPAMFRASGFKKIDRKSFKIFLGIGFIVALHWICFYGSIKLANSSIAMICLAFIPIFTAFFEAIFNRRSLRWLDVITGLFCLPGMWMIFQNIELNFRLGFFVGILSALLSACFASLNKKYIHHNSAVNISWIEMFSVWIFLSFFLPIIYFYDPDTKFLPTGMDWVYMIILVVFCTYLAYVLAIRSLTNLSAFSAMLVFNLEPVYGILIAIFLLNEHKQLNTMFYAGVIIIMISVFLHPILLKKFDRDSLN